MDEAISWPQPRRGCGREWLLKCQRRVMRGNEAGDDDDYDNDYYYYYDDDDGMYGDN
jgi:hypothetical protein